MNSWGFIACLRDIAYCVDIVWLKDTSHCPKKFFWGDFSQILQSSPENRVRLVIIMRP